MTIDGLDVTVTATETPRTVSIERVWLDDIRPRAGRTVPLKVLPGRIAGRRRSRRCRSRSANAPKELTVLVTDGRQLNAMEQRELAGRCGRRRSRSWFAC